MGFIYKTTNTLTGKIYIGKSKYNNPSYLGSGLKLVNAIKKYGAEKFEKEIIEECSDEDTNSREEFWIRFFNSRDNNIGYNISKGGEGGAHYWATLTDDQRKEHNKKISESRKGKPRPPHSADTKAKQSRSFWDLVEKNPNFLAERALRKCKSYVCVNHETGVLYRTGNLKDFCKEHMLNVSAMHHNARTRKNFYNGVWSCAVDTFHNINDNEVIALLYNECIKNNQEYKNRIGQSRRRYD